MQLRPYQEAAINAVYEHIARCDDNPCVVIPTGGGKGVLVGRICADVVDQWNGRILVLTHVKELVDQNATQASRFISPLLVGVYSAGLRRRDIDHPVIVASIQSVYKRACDLGRFDIILVDEAHLIPPDGEGMYRRFFADARVINPNVRIVGLTATPFRMRSGSICESDGILNHVCYEVGVRELIVDGYLSPLVTKAGATKVDTSLLHIRAGEFIAEEAEAMMNQEDRVQGAVAEIAELTRERNACLIFAAGVDHARHVATEFQDQHGIDVGMVFGDTPGPERDAILARFKRGDLRYLVNVNVLTTGFDAPHIDTVVLLRPTMSPGLYYQMVGRGFRLHPSKTACLVLDYGGNVLRHGPVDALQIDARSKHGAGAGETPAKECPDCRALIAMGYAICPECGYEFPPPERELPHDVHATPAGILTGQHHDTEYEVRTISYSVHQKHNAPEDAPRSMRVEYEIGWNQYISEWICVEHTGFARRKAEAWWRERSDAPVPDSAAQAVQLAREGSIAWADTITVRETAGEKFPNIIGHQLRMKPSWCEPGMDEEEPLPVGDWPLDYDEPPF